MGAAAGGPCDLNDFNGIIPFFQHPASRIQYLESDFFPRTQRRRLTSCHSKCINEVLSETDIEMAFWSSLHYEDRSV